MSAASHADARFVDFLKRRATVSIAVLQQQVDVFDEPVPVLEARIEKTGRGRFRFCVSRPPPHEAA